MAEFTKAADRGVWSESFILLRVRVLSILYWEGVRTVWFPFVYDSKVVDNDRMVKLGAGQRTIRQVVYEIIGRQDISLHLWRIIF